jgi:hypothetical protein
MEAYRLLGTDFIVRRGYFNLNSGGKEGSLCLTASCYEWLFDTVEPAYKDVL